MIGGRYSLLGIPHDNEALMHADPVSIHPDFWVAFFWKRLMGTAVLNATAGAVLDPSIRAYAHCGMPPSMHLPPRRLGDGASLVDRPPTPLRLTRGGGGGRGGVERVELR